jgi:transcriptional regulator with XRE-family HTH domain
MAAAKSKDLPGIGARLKHAREAAGLTQDQVAKLLGLPRPAISEMESEARTVSAGELKQLAACYKVSLAWLAGEPMYGADDKIKMAARRLSALRDEDVDTVMRIVDSFRRQSGSGSKRSR